jgi:hypothetical protein
MDKYGIWQVLYGSSWGERERERVSTNFRLTQGRLHFYMLLGFYEHIEMISGNGSGVSISQEHKEAVGLECAKLREIWG